MQNPWLNLPRHNSYLLQQDTNQVKWFNRGRDSRYFVHDELLPEPFIGRLDAPLVMLSKNPGFTAEDDSKWPGGDAKVHSDEKYAEALWRNLHALPVEFPFYPLNPAFVRSTPGGVWWAARTYALRKKVGDTRVAGNLLAIEYFPYHSKRFHPRTPRVPSQDYTRHLVCSAMERGSVIVLTRGRRLWFELVPELQNYSRLYKTNSTGAVHLTERNLTPDGWRAVCAAAGS